MASSNITVYTSITDEKDELLNGQLIGDAHFVAFTPTTYAPTWEIRKPYGRFIDERRNSRIQKMLAHQFIDSEYSIYIDGNVRLLVPPEELVAKYLKGHDLAVWKHPTRDCIYDEAIACAKRKLDDPEVIIEQATKYENAGFAKHKGLAECNVILRRHTKKVEEFNNAWWSEYCRHSCRDQISFMYAVDRVGLRVNIIGNDPFYLINGEDRAVRQSGDTEIIPHKKLNL